MHRTPPILCIVEIFVLGFRGNVAVMFISGNKWLKNELLALKERQNTAAVT